MEDLRKESEALVQRTRDRATEILQRQEEAKLDNMTQLRDMLRTRPLVNLGRAFDHVNGCPQCTYAVLSMDYSQACSDSPRKAMEHYRDGRKINVS